MLQIDMTAKPRTTFGKGAARSLRRTGKTPAVLYGPGIDPMALELDTKPFTKVLLSIHRRNAVINLTVGQEASRHVVTKDIQTDPVTDQVLHADFLEISLEESLVFEVPLRYKGKAKGVDMGGDLQVSRTTVPLKGKALEIPDEIEIDISPLGPGEAITCKDLAIPSQVSLEADPAQVCVAVSALPE